MKRILDVDGICARAPPKNLIAALRYMIMRSGILKSNRPALQIGRHDKEDFDVYKKYAVPRDVAVACPGSPPWTATGTRFSPGDESQTSNPPHETGHTILASLHVDNQPDAPDSLKRPSEGIVAKGLPRTEPPPCSHQSPRQERPPSGAAAPASGHHAKPPWLVPGAP